MKVLMIFDQTQAGLGGKESPEKHRCDHGFR